MLGIALFVAGLGMSIADPAPAGDYLHPVQDISPPSAYHVIGGSMLVVGPVCVLFGFLFWSIALFRGPAKVTSPPIVRDKRKIHSKVIAFVLVTVACAHLMSPIDKQMLADISSKSPGEFIQAERELHQQGFIMHFIEILFLGGIYLGLVEAVAFMVHGVMRSKETMTPETPKRVAAQESGLE
jgi:hypothetical protein